MEGTRRRRGNDPKCVTMRRVAQKTQHERKVSQYDSGVVLHFGIRLADVVSFGQQAPCAN